MLLLFHHRLMNLTTFLYKSTMDRHLWWSVELYFYRKRNDHQLSRLFYVSSIFPSMIIIAPVVVSGHWHFIQGLKGGVSAQPTMLYRVHAGPARAARTGPVPIWPRALQWPRMGLPHEFHMVQSIYANFSFFKIIEKVS